MTRINFESGWISFGTFVMFYQNFSTMRQRNHLHNPILINKKIWSFQITMNYYWCAVVQIIHSASLKLQLFKEDIIPSSITNKPEASLIYIQIKGREHTASRAILKRLRSSNWLLGRWINLYKLPLQKTKYASKL